MSESETKGSDPNVSEKSGENVQVSTTHSPRRAWWHLGGKDISFATVDPASVSASSSASLQDDTESGGENNIHGSVFDDTAAAEFYKPIEKYEGLHRFDPNATWGPEEERKLVRTV
jgi:hypothetical protein